MVYCKFLMIFWGIFLLSSNIGAATKVDKIIKRMQKKYRSTKTIRIEFKQISRFKLVGTESEIIGTIEMEGKNKFKLDSEDQVLVNNGATVWRYNRLENQVLIDRAKQNEENVLLNDFLYELQNHYSSELLTEKKAGKYQQYTIKLTPKPSQQSFFKSIKIWVKDKSWQINRVLYVDHNDNETEFFINSMKFNARIPNSTFTFIPPEGTEVVDLRF